MITYQIEKLFDELYIEIPDLFEEHQKECGIRKEGEDSPLYKPDPDWGSFKSFEEHGILLICTARDGRRLIGYTVSLYFEHPRHIGLITSSTEMFFVHPDYRGNKVGETLLRFMTAALKCKGVHYSTITHTEYNDVGMLYKKLGYSPIERIYGMVLNEVK